MRGGRAAVAERPRRVILRLSLRIRESLVARDALTRARFKNLTRFRLSSRNRLSRGQPMATFTLTARWIFPVSSPPVSRGAITIDGETIVAVEPRGNRK